MDDKFETRGTHYLVDDEVYDGQFENGLYHGDGMFKDKNGEIFTGAFKNGLKHGIGLIEYPDGTRQMGSWENGENIEWISRE